MNDENKAAAGFPGRSVKVLAEPDKRNRYLVSPTKQLDTVGKAFMGLTLGCARCTFSWSTDPDTRELPVPVIFTPNTASSQLDDFAARWLARARPQRHRNGGSESLSRQA